jgi:two-component system chemotaxis response regulator CheB
MAVVQDPGTAAFPIMPSAAIEETPVDHILDLQGIGKLLADIGDGTKQVSIRNALNDCT